MVLFRQLGSFTRPHRNKSIYKSSRVFNSTITSTTPNAFFIVRQKLIFCVISHALAAVVATL